MVRLGTLILILLPFLAVAQEQKAVPTFKSDEWNTLGFTQEDKIYSRSVWTFVDNPALAGFDRKLAIAYRFRMKNLAMGIPNEDGNLELGFMKHEAFIDMPFGGPKQNWGLGLYYTREKEIRHWYHRVQLAQSHRIKLVKDHFLILGVSFTIQFSKLDNWDNLVFGDMVDPRYGLVYPTHEQRPSDQRALPYVNAGLKYYWKRFSFDYSVQNGPNGTWALAGMPTSEVTNKLRAAYHFNVGDGVTISPEFVGRIKTVYGHFYANNSDRLVDKATNNFGFFSAFATITYKDVVYGQLGIADLNRFTFRAGYQLKDYLVVEVGGSSYIDETMNKIAGPAGVQVGIRYQIRAWNR
ncbi:MAG: type IX secretion system membrane protein PorP/SprF [Flavobacteriales bacterium]